MRSPEYRRRLQELTDYLLATLPASWHEATLRARFPSRVRTSLEVSFRSSPHSSQTPVDIPMATTRGLAGAARAVRTELASAGNPECKTFLFSLSKAGTSSLDVEY